MSNDNSVMDDVCAALHGEPRVRPAVGPIYLALSNGELLIEDEVDHIAGEKPVTRGRGTGAGD